MAKVETGFSLVQSVGAELHLRWRPLTRFYVDAGAGAEAFAYWTKSRETEARLEMPVILGLGLGLW